MRCGAALLVLCAIAAAGATAQTGAAGNALHFAYVVDGTADWHDQTIGTAYGPPSLVRFAVGSTTGYGVAVQGPEIPENTPASPPSTSPPTAPGVTGPATTPLPLPKRPHSLRVKLVFTWTWRHRTTWLDKATIGRFPNSMTLTFRCLGRRCPRHATTSATGTRHVRRMLRGLRGRRYEVSERLQITLAAPGYRPEAAEATFRNGRIPRLRLLNS